MNHHRFMPQPGISLMKFCLLLVIMISMTNLGVEGVLAQPARSSFLGYAFNITPGYTDSQQSTSAVAYNNHSDEWLVVWKDNSIGPYGILGRRVEKNANLLDEFYVQPNSQTQNNPAVAFDNTQYRYLAVWENLTSSYIEGRILNSDGSGYTLAFLIASCDDCSVPDVVYNPYTEDYLVVWDEYVDANDKDVRGRFVGPEGDPDPSGAFPITTVADVIEQQPAVVVDPSNGRYLVVFSHNTTGNFNIGGQRLYSTGSKNGSMLAISGDAGDELAPDVAFNPKDDRAFIAWQHDVTTGTMEVKGRLLL